MLMITVVVALLAVFMMMVLGYRFNFKTRSVQSTALVQYSSFPRGATVQIDGAGNDRTQTKGTVLPGRHQFAMQLAGYELWQKTLEVEASTVTWLDYVRLVPTEKQITRVETETPYRLTGALASPDRRFMMGTGHDESGAPTLVLLDFRNSQRPETREFVLSADVVTGLHERDMQHAFAVVEWNGASRTALIRHTYVQDESERSEWLWVDRDDMVNVVNLTTLFSLSMRDVHLGDGKDVYVLQDTGDIRQAAADSGTLSRPIASHVDAFSLYRSDTLAYTGTDEGERVAGVWRSGWQEPTVIVRLAPDDTQALHVQVSHYYNKDTVVVSTGAKVRIYRGGLPSHERAVPAFLQSQVSFTFNRPIGSLQISANGRFVVAENETGLMSYDLERQSASQDMKKYHAAAVRWLDNYHMWQIDQTGQLVMQEFDGVNEQPLLAVSPGFDPLLTQDGRYVYGFWYNDGVLELRRLAMTL